MSPLSETNDVDPELISCIRPLRLPHSLAVCRLPSTVVRKIGTNKSQVYSFTGAALTPTTPRSQSSHIWTTKSNAYLSPAFTSKLTVYNPPASASKHCKHWGRTVSLHLSLSFCLPFTCLSPITLTVIEGFIVTVYVCCQNTTVQRLSLHKVY